MENTQTYSSVIELGNIRLNNVKKLKSSIKRSKHKDTKILILLIILIFVFLISKIITLYLLFSKKKEKRNIFQKHLIFLNHYRQISL